MTCSRCGYSAPNDFTICPSCGYLIWKSGSYTVPGLGKRKTEIISNCGNVLDLAIAMLETERMRCDYIYGDGKTGDSANFGIFKQNWGMIRKVWSEFSSFGPFDYYRGEVLDKNLALDIEVLHASQNYYGIDKWFAGHRNGASGLINPDTKDIKLYKTAVYWIRDKINSDQKYYEDDTRFWVDVPAI